ncbi:glycosyl hydrolase family 18 protein [Massilia rubra]|uniref:GH18 domain-containing protein n=1 Tax=Massilia rubra TaxID=2607910 RepID=A0ABX0LSD3_9BURK|nr:glycosyl hydrolase family 18 protein [Massilia rubra]NHZ35087.1 hypothetical protein [Massilia rubra]
MPWTKTVNTAVTQAAWISLVSVAPDCTPEQARRKALLNPEIGYFFHCREPMVVSDPAWPAPRQFNAGDCVFFAGTPSTGSAPQADSYTKNGMSVAYVNNISRDNLLKVLDYVDADGNAAVDVACIFAANLNMSIKPGYTALAPAINPLPGGTYACANDATLATLGSGAIEKLQSRGVTVLLTFLNNHDAAGWSNFATPELAGNFVDQLASVVRTYGLDGIDIDDEYSSVAPVSDTALVMTTSMIKEAMPDKILSKALFDDLGYFQSTYQHVQLGETLTYGWEMSYGNDPDTRLPPYTKYMKANALVLGFEAPSPLSVPDTVAWLKKGDYAGVMAYAFETDANADLLGALIIDWCGPGAWRKAGQSADGKVPG